LGIARSPKNDSQLCAAICEEFEINAQTCETTVLKFVNELIDNGIVREAAT
jgi:hypothetical protein